MNVHKMNILPVLVIFLPMHGTLGENMYHMFKAMGSQSGRDKEKVWDQNFRIIEFFLKNRKVTIHKI